MPKDGLITGIHRASLHGSAKTVANNVDAAERFVQTARELGIKTQKWSNLTNRHVHEVVSEWQQEGLKDSTIKGYMSGVRALARAWGNLKVAETDNRRFNIGNRVYVDNVDKSILPESYERAVETLRNGSDIEKRVGLVLELARHLGLRFEEAYKFDCQHSLVGGNTPETFRSLYITDGTKGGRDRNLHTITPQMREVIARHHAFTSGRGNLMMPGWKEKSVRQEFYKIARQHGISRKDSNGSFHAARHARAHEIFRQICGFEPPCRFTGKDEFLSEAMEIRGSDFARYVNEAEVQVRTQFGHGAGRKDISAQYLGSWK
ncbi:phage integrase N-terminal domain-containing protein [Salidesulfovibrio brasiliensis]|uniref:phage integrase N-terminal domain-containing protein n=1 Tax=Salidesulfovibrio brasiliensis TaxID=221711 RepID=UPI000A82C16C|nr:phage integrase N-terminal domain-containing protein [Salidesulfovibrio brasiliensis]